MFSFVPPIKILISFGTFFFRFLPLVKMVISLGAITYVLRLRKSF